MPDWCRKNLCYTTLNPFRQQQLGRPGASSLSTGGDGGSGVADIVTVPSCWLLHFYVFNAIQTLYLVIFKCFYTHFTMIFKCCMKRGSIANTAHGDELAAAVHLW